MVETSEPDPGQSGNQFAQTNWSLVRELKSSSASLAAQAQQALVLRYSGAVRRYVGAIVRDDHAADDLAQEVAVKMLDGDFSGADPNRGRFRDYLKMAIRNLVRNYWRQAGKSKAAESLEAVADDAGPDVAWQDSWRETLLEMTWKSLQRWERKRSDSVAYRLLKLRADYEDETLEQIRDRLSQMTSRDFEVGTVRTQLHRARAKFAELLTAEIERTLRDPGPTAIRDEIAELGLSPYLEGVS